MNTVWRGYIHPGIDFEVCHPSTDQRSEKKKKAEIPRKRRRKKPTITTHNAEWRFQTKIIYD